MALSTLHGSKISMYDLRRLLRCGVKRTRRERSRSTRTASWWRRDHLIIAGGASAMRFVDDCSAHAAPADAQPYAAVGG